LPADQGVGASLVPVDGAEIFAAAGDPDPLDAIHRVHVAANDDVLDVLVHPGKAALDVFVGRVALAGAPALREGIVLGDEEGRDAGGGHGGPGFLLLAVRPAAVGKLHLFPRLLDGFPILGGDFDAGLLERPGAQDAILAVA